jgi:cell fate (sporulation/competence/biofilm development) regulator YlbF (YheA/YmcA/DUF963 family)
MPDQKNTKLEQVAQITQVISSISVAVGIIVALTTIYTTFRNTKAAAAGAKLSALAAVKQFVEDDDKVRKQAEHFLDSQYSNEQILLEFVKQKKSGKRAYDSDELRDLREVGHHYEELATLVRYDYLDFDLVFETIPFPDDFWNATEGFRKELQTKNWSNGQGLRDFWADLEYLKSRYDEARRKNSNNKVQK